MDSYIGEVRIFPYNFAPKGWAFCNGQPISVNQNHALVSVIGTVFGGDGIKTVNLPNLIQTYGSVGDAPIGSGCGPNLTPRCLGPSTVGTTLVQLKPSQIPSHSHSLKAEGAGAMADLLSSPADAYLSRSYVNANPSPVLFTYNPPPADRTKLTCFCEPALSSTGSSTPHDNMQPYLAMNFYISLSGVFPARQ